jgi:hypothetical protein
MFLKIMMVKGIYLDRFALIFAKLQPELSKRLQLYEFNIFSLIILM